MDILLSQHHLCWKDIFPFNGLVTLVKKFSWAADVYRSALDFAVLLLLITLDHLSCSVFEFTGSPPLPANICC